MGDTGMLKHQRMVTVLALRGVYTEQQRAEDSKAELPFPCLPQPLPACKQEARLGSLPGPRLGQEAEETSVEDSPQHRKGLLRNSWEGK